MFYMIHEANMDRLEKKITRIKNKCAKYGNDFKYEVVGEEFKTCRDENGKDYLAKYFLVEAEGTAKLNEWEFVAKIDHTSEGNIVRGYGEHEVPERYYTCSPYCEHCKTSRERKNSFVVYNKETNEFKQVGRNCLCDFTNGMSAEQVAAYISEYDMLIQGEQPYEGSNYTCWLDTKEVLAIAFAIVEKTGFVSKNSESFEQPTAMRTSAYYDLQEHRSWLSGRQIEDLIEEQEKIGYKLTDSHRQLAKEALDWAKLQDEANNYMHNLITVCKMEYITHKEIGILASLTSVYFKYLDREVKKQKALANNHSEWIGNINDRITIDLTRFEVVAGWETDFGYTKIYKIEDTNGNVYTWKTSGYIPDDAKKLIGTIKAHNTYGAVKQTELTRCKAV